MGKKSKEPEPEIPNSSSSGNIFKSLFNLDIQESNNPTSDSIFSDSNPFRSKPTDESQKLQQILHLDIDSPEKESNSSAKLLISRKRKFKNADSDDFDIESKVKKSKVVVPESDKVSNFDVGTEKKKKRKRDEVEAEYEERKYGGVDLELKEVERGKVKIGEKRKVFDKGEEDLLVPKEGFDDEEKLLRTVFVGNLPLKVKKKALLREFSEFGEIDSIRLRSIPLLDDKTPRKGAILKKKINDAVDRVNAYIVFKAQDSAQASLSHNMAVFSFLLLDVEKHSLNEAIYNA